MRRHMLSILFAGLATAAAAGASFGATCQQQAQTLETRKEKGHSKFGVAFGNSDRPLACAAVRELLDIIDEMNDLSRTPTCNELRSRWSAEQIAGMRNNVRYNWKQMDCENLGKDRSCERTGMRLNSEIQAAYRALNSDAPENTSDRRCGTADQILALSEQIEDMQTRSGCAVINAEGQKAELARMRSDMADYKKQLGCRK